jgi:hypothetical protein
MRTILVFALMVGALWLGPASRAQARPNRPDQIPNGQVNRCANCHISPSGGGLRTEFGLDIEEFFLTPQGTVVWGPELAALDSDGDGRSNGSELQDPSGTWRAGQAQPGDPGAVTNPGVPDAPARVPALGSGTRAGLLLAFASLLMLSRTASYRGRPCSHRPVSAEPSESAR